MVNQEGLIAEYSALRQEIVQTVQKSLQFRVAALPVASAFIVYGFQAQNSISFLAAIVILLAALYFGANSTMEIISVATYLYTIIEPKVEGLQWETMLAESRKREKLFSISSFYPIAICIQALLGIGCIFFTWRFLQDYSILNVLLYSCVIFILVVSFIIVSVYALHVSSKKYYSNSISRWKKLEEDLHPSVEAIRTNS